MYLYYPHIDTSIEVNARPERNADTALQPNGVGLAYGLQCSYNLQPDPA
jgi:hypothetical protein